MNDRIKIKLSPIHCRLLLQTDRVAKNRRALARHNFGLKPVRAKIITRLLKQTAMNSTQMKQDLRLYLFTITSPIMIQIDTGNHKQSIRLWRKYNTHALVIMRDAFQRVDLATLIFFYLIRIELTIF